MTGFPVTKLLAAPALRRLSALLLGAVLLAGCATSDRPVNPEDPNENFNRKVYAFNVGVDRALLRPTSQVYGAVVPSPVRQGVSNFADNLSLPSAVINHTLQGDFAAAADNAGRFIVNSTFGLGGLLDPSTALGTPEDDTDFGETLHVWGVGEGRYGVSPIAGPTTTRDTVGRWVDLVLNPVGYVLDVPEINYARGATVLETVDDRYRFTDTVDGILYDSADGYAQLRLIYLQNRRFELGQPTGAPLGPTDTEGDIYDDLFFE